MMEATTKRIDKGEFNMLFRKNDDVINELYDKNEKLNEESRKLRQKITELENFIEFLNSQVCDGRQIFGIQKIKYKNDEVYLGYILAHKYEMEPQISYSYDIFGYLSINTKSPVYKAELFQKLSKRPVDIVNRLEISKHYVCDKDLYGIGIGSSGVNTIKELARQLNCSEVYGQRRPLDDYTEEERKIAERLLFKFYKKNGFEQPENTDRISYKLP